MEKFLCLFLLFIILLASCSSQTSEYLKNPYYKLRLAEFKTFYNKKSKIVMLGDSITQDADWKNLLERNDVANMGIWGDTTDGVINRLNYVYQVNPDICFIMIGINDLGTDQSVSYTFNNYKTIVDKLRSKGVKVVIQSTLLTAHEEINDKVSELNSKLQEFANSNNIQYLELNDVMTENDKIKPNFTTDGLHLSKNAYNTWKDKLIPFINNLT